MNNTKYVPLITKRKKTFSTIYWERRSPERQKRPEPTTQIKTKIAFTEYTETDRKPNV
jgi:hypothetical protein